MEKILSLLENNSKLTNSQIAVMLNIEEKEVAAKVSEYEENGTILAYKTIVDWDKTKRESVTALIEIKVIPQMGKGFDKVARRICQYDEVRSLFLMSGGFDLAVIIEGRTMKEVALFVAEKLAVLEGVTSTATHFVLKKYKDKGVEYKIAEKDERGYGGL